MFILTNTDFLSVVDYFQIQSTKSLIATLLKLVMDDLVIFNYFLQNKGIVTVSFAKSFHKIGMISRFQKIIDLERK